MTEAQREKYNYISHPYAAEAGGGDNALVPGVGIAVDTPAMVCMGSAYDRGYRAGEAAAAVAGTAVVLGLGYWLYKKFVEQ